MASTPVTSYLIYLIFIATLGPLQFGFHLGELNAPQKAITCQLPLLSIPSAANTSRYGSGSLPQCISMDAAQWGLVQSIFTIGGFCGAVLGGPVATKYGRLLATRALTMVLFLGPLLEAFAPNFTTLTIGRWVSGVGAGAATVVCPIYIAELSPPDKRGLFGAFTQVMINLGILISQVLGLFLSYGNMWRVILATSAGIALLSFIGFLSAPESPKWLIENNMIEHGFSVQQKLTGADAGESMPLLQSNRRHESSSASIIDVLRVPKYRVAAIAVLAAMMAQQLTGINSVVMYSVSILGPIMPTGAAVVTVLVSAINVIATLICAPLADKLGRKTCLLMSTIIMGISSMILAVGLSCNIPPLSVIALLLFVCGFAVGLGPVPFILASELVDARAVGAVSSIALGGNWISTFCVAQFFPIINLALPRGQVYWVFAGLAAVFTAFIAWWVPESKDMSSPDEVWGRIPDEMEEA